MSTRALAAGLGAMDVQGRVTICRLFVLVSATHLLITNVVVGMALATRRNHFFLPARSICTQAAHLTKLPPCAPEYGAYSRCILQSMQLPACIDQLTFSRSRRPGFVPLKVLKRVGGA